MQFWDGTLDGMQTATKNHVNEHHAEVKANDNLFYSNEFQWNSVLRIILKWPLQVKLKKVGGGG